ncbi:MAG: UDP-N-acetylmuramoyl-tripeptide--D-alanyl-D-alanine ligase [Clostridia bacterium]|nr:UDP-N-acetylmuramoyl-tripeptide--D-alanyl-D-alanine ligase [Clostridia bacterium]
MPYLKINIIFVLFLAYFLRTNRKGLHMLQLEHYYKDRYIKWMKQNISIVFDFKKIGLLLISSIVLALGYETAGIILTMITYVLLFLTIPVQKEKTRFVVTKRVKRQFLTYFVLIVLLGILVNVYPDKVSMIVLNILAMISYVFVYIVALITSPIEKSINNGFCKKASNKLNENSGLKVIGVTGSFGKTSTKHVINTILSQKYNCLMTPASYNTTMGVVRTINEQLKPIHNTFICEMGAKYRGDIKEICDIVHPDFAVITAVGPQHLDTFKTVENVAKTKFELVDSLDSENGLAFVNWEDENIRKVEISKEYVKYGLHEDSDYYAENIEIDEKGSSFDVVMPGDRKINIKTKLLGKLNVLNIVGGVAVADKLGLSEEQIKMGVKFIKPVEHRLELRPNPNGSVIIDDSYNSNERGAGMALEVLGSFKNRKRVLITPGIVELGDRSYEINKKLGFEATKHSDFIILVGEKQAGPMLDGVKEAKYPENQIMVAKNLDEALKKMYELMDANTVVLLENDLPDNYL